MNHFSRLVSKVSSAAALSALIGAVALVPAACAAQLVGVLPEPSALLLHSSQGYLGVEVRDIDNERATALKLKEVTGAEITYIDHDAPAGKFGIHVHDVVLQMNGQQVQGAEQLRRMLRETPAGRSVTLLISRDGQQQTINVQLADRAKVEQQAWPHPVLPDPDQQPDTAVIIPPTHSSGAGNGFFGAMVLGTPTIGVEVDPLGSQLADYFGVKDGQGLLVKRVAENSPASTAGLKAGDVITKVNGESTPTLNIWYHALHANRGKQVQVTIVRNHKEQTVSLQAGDPKHKGELCWPDVDISPMHLIEPGDIEPEIERNLAQLDSKLNPQVLAQQAISEIDAERLAEQMREAARALDDKKLQPEMRNLGKDLQSFHLDFDYHDTF
ncbi:MAG: PDZ domain-containing protein [Silvibacterium sp.]|nr:PDZ domain-containing protein [Silvibacterium sp.]